MASITLTNLRTRLRIYLNDSNKKTWADDDELNLFINHSIIKFTTDLPISKYQDYTVATDFVTDVHTFELPSDLVVDHMIRGYFESATKQENILRINAQPGVWVDSYEPIGYLMDWPGEGYLYLPRESQGTSFRLFYGGHHDEWLEDETDSFNLYRARWGEQAVLAYAAYLSFNPSSSRRAQLEQWTRRGDQNVGNPLEEEADRWLGMYNSLLAQHADVPDTWEFQSNA